MKRLTIVAVMMLALIVSTSAFAWTGEWSNYYPFGRGPQCFPIAAGSLVQLIHAGPDGQVDDPIALCMSQPDPLAAMNAWVAAGTPPVGDDTLRDQTVFMDLGAGCEGYFAKTINGVDSEEGDPWYTRYFNFAEFEIVDFSMSGNGWYGTVGDPLDPNDPIYELVLTGGLEGMPKEFGNYIIMIEAECIPEPATMVIGGIALLLGFFRRKK